MCPQNSILHVLHDLHGAILSGSEGKWSGAAFPALMAIGYAQGGISANSAAPRDSKFKLILYSTTKNAKNTKINYSFLDCFIFAISAIFAVNFGINLTCDLE
jgi:hypothetical protein